MRDHPNGPNLNLLFVGDVVGDAGLELLERRVPVLRRDHAVHAAIVNGEDASITGPSPIGGCGTTPEAAERLFALGADVVTGGNHSWDEPRAADGRWRGASRRCWARTRTSRRSMRACCPAARRS